MARLQILWGTLYSTKEHMRKALEPRIHAHFERKKLADRGVELACPRPTGLHGESGRARSGGHLTVDFCKLDGKLITTHHVYPSDEAYEGEDKKKSKSCRP
ncbi:hypothetical protein H4582DRAFT_2070194 [Lactarius indigo]|nr:hypothetical protein H4582DRAFT_2070194 [Lactarius indigo]